MNYEETIAYIHGAYWKGTKDGLQRTRELLALLGNPQDKLRFIQAEVLSEFFIGFASGNSKVELCKRQGVAGFAG